MSNASETISDAENVDEEARVEDAPSAESVLGNEKRTEALLKGNWFYRSVVYYLRQRKAASPAERTKLDGKTQHERALQIIRRACIKSAVTGAAAGSVATGATVLTAESQGVAAVVTLPALALAIGGEMLYRGIVHVEMTLDLADVFAVEFNPDDPSDLFRLLALAFHAEKHRGEDDPGKDLVDRIVHLESHEVGEQIGSRLLGESVMRNVVPFVGIVSSSITNWRLTRHVGDTVRRYVRYHRALEDAFADAQSMCDGYLDLLIEGLWFVFTADGRLNHEEAAVLAGLLRKLDPIQRGAVARRFTEDELDWTNRITAIPDGPMRDAFQHALEVAAAVDKSVSLPERKILRRSAQALGRTFDIERLNKMIHEFEEVGVLAT